MHNSIFYAYDILHSSYRHSSHAIQRRGYNLNQQEIEASTQGLLLKLKHVQFLKILTNYTGHTQKNGAVSI